MASVTFYSNFSKKKNSTKIPGGAGTSKTVRLKDNTSLYNPTFELTGNFPDYTYASWQGLYFYVTNITSVANGMYEIECDLDPIGSARGDIKGTTAYVQRCSTDYDVAVPDPEVGNVMELAGHGKFETSLGSGNTPIIDNTGCYIMRAVGRGGIKTFILSDSDLNNILDFMFDDTGTFWEAAWDTVIKTVYNPFQYIVSLMYTPVSITWMSQGASPASQVDLGWWNANGYGYLATYTGRNFTAFDLSTPTRYFNDFRDFDPRFTQVAITLPDGNTKEIPAAWLSHGTLKMQILMDIFTGDAKYILRDSDGILATFTSKLAFPVQIGQMDSSLNSAVTGALGAAASAQAGSALGVVSSLTGAVSGIIQPNPSINGTQGNSSTINSVHAIYFDVLRYVTTIVDPAQLGRPLMENRTLSSLASGSFVKCAGAHVDTSLPEQYKNVIDDTLNSGIFLD